MLANQAAEAFGTEIPECTGTPCTSGGKAEIEIHGYSEGNAGLWLCRNCAVHLARKLMEDVSEIMTGDRHA